MPEHFEPVPFLRRGLIYTAAVQGLGALGLWWAFARAGADQPLWSAVFHSVSAYCTAGFSVYSNGLENFSADPGINMILAAVSILGAIGFIVVSDVWLKWRGRVSRITFTSRIILLATAGALFLSTILLLLDPFIAAMPWKERILTAFFHAMSAHTTVGFNTIALGQLSSGSVMVLLILMILGASPSGTGGGLKSTTWSAALGACWSNIRGRKETTFLGSTIPSYRVLAAFASITLYMVIYVLGCYVLLAVESKPFEDLIFEAASALSTVGLSRGVTAQLSDTGKWVIMILMFIGRVGVVSMGLAALAKTEPEEERPAPVEDIVVG
jgi:trk system potassium uptake protein TrkH